VPANHVKGLLAGAVSADETLSEVIPVAKLLTPADGKSSKAKTQSTASPVRKKKPEPGKTAKAIEEPATESSLPPVVAKGSVPPPPPPPPPLPAPPLPAPPVAGVQVANEAAASPPAVPGLEAEPAMVPHSRHSPGIDLPFDVSPPTSSGAHARVAADKTSTSGPGKAPAAKEKPKFQINYTWVAVGVVVVAAAGLFIFAQMYGSGPRDKSGKQTASTPSEKTPEEGPKEAPTSPDGAKQPPPDDHLMDLVLKGGKPVGPAKAPTAPAKPQEKKPDNTGAGKDKWFDASKGPALGKNVSVAVTSAKLGKFIQVSRSKRGGGLKVTLKVTNTIKERRLKCQWNVLTQVPPDSMLVDNFDQPNAYSLKKPYVVLKSDEPIDPEDSLEVDLIFEKPIKTAKYLHLKLPGTIFNEPDFIKIEIPKEMITAADENEEENPGPAASGPPDPNKLPPAPSDQPGPAEKGKPTGNAPEIPDIGLPAPPTDSRWQPRGNRDVELADAEQRRPAAVREQRITDFDDDPATVERFGQPSSARDPDRRESRHSVRR
jgi:hypothetical protein